MAERPVPKSATPAWQPRHEPARDLGRLLLGHLSRFRSRELQDVATRALRTPGGQGAWGVSLVNASLRARQVLDHSLRLTPRRRLSKLRFELCGGSRPTAPLSTLSLLCPTRERVGNVVGFLDSVARTAVAPGRIEALFYVDSDDPQRAEYEALFARAHWRFGRIGRCVLRVGEPVGVPGAWNTLAEEAEGDVLMMANDDQLYVDHGWDVALDARIAELTALHRDGVLCLYFDHGQYAEGTCDFPILTRPWYDTLGYFTPTMFQQWEVEKWVIDIAERLRRLYPVPDVLVEHRHYQDYKAPFDATYQRHRMTREKSFADHALFLRTERQREAEADRLRAVIARSARPRAGLPRQGRAPAVRDAAGFWFTAALRENHLKLLAEYDRARCDTDEAGGVGEVVLFAHGDWTPTAYDSFPLTTALAESIPEATLDEGRVELLVLPPGARRRPPGPPGEGVLRVLFGLRVPQGAVVRVGEREPAWDEGACLVYDAHVPAVIRNGGTRTLVALTFVMTSSAPGE